jgi:hypothetical protein
MRKGLLGLESGVKHFGYKVSGSVFRVEELFCKSLSVEFRVLNSGV